MTNRYTDGQPGFPHDPPELR